MNGTEKEQIILKSALFFFPHVTSDNIYYVN